MRRRYWLLALAGLATALCAWRFARKPLTTLC